MLQTDTVRDYALRQGVSSTRLLYPVFAVLLLAAATPIFTDRIPPLADYINHLARMHVIATEGHDPILSRFYAIHWAIIPNLLMDAVVPALTRVMDVYLSGQIFVFLTILLQVSGVAAVHRALCGRMTPWPLVTFLFVYNSIMLFGFMNYLFGMGLALWGLAAWIWLRDRPVLLRAAVSTVVVLGLFFCHLFAVGLYGLALLSCEGWIVATYGVTSRRRLLADAAAFVLPFLPVIPLMLSSPTIGLAGENSWDSTGKIDGLYYIFQTYSDLVDLSIAGLLIGGAVWAARSGLLRMHPVGWTLLVASGIVYMAMPRMLFGSWVADQRLPIGALFMLLGFIRFEFSDRWSRYAFYAFILGVALVRYLDIQINWQQLNSVYDDFQEATRLIDPGSTVLVANADQPDGSDATNEAFSHAPCIALIERSSLVSTAFAVPGKQIMQLREPYLDKADSHDDDPPSVSQLLAEADGPAAGGDEHYWANWPEKFNYVYVLYTDGNANPDPDHLALAYEGPHFQLYRVVRPPADADKDEE